MVSLMDQLIEDLRAHFSNNLEYSNIMIKEVYDIFPKITYPAITIGEIENSDNDRFFDETERVTDLAYQFTIHAEQSLDKTAIQNVRAICDIVDTYLKGDKYRCLRRLGSPQYQPLASDNNVMLGYLRYDCSVEKNTNTIYRRY